MKTLIHYGVAIALTICIASGCRLLSNPTLAGGHSPLKPPQPAPDSVAMEIIWVRFPQNDPLFDDATWREIDETQIDPAVRRELLNNGLRAGVIGSSVPAAISRALHQEEPKSTDHQVAALEKNDELMSDPPVHGHVVRLRRNQRSEIQASEIYPSLPLLVSNGTELTGHTYEQAQAVYSLRVDPSLDRAVRVEVTPELEYGTPKFRFTSGEDRFLRQASLRDQKVFDHLRMSVRLSPGDMLVLMSLPNAGSRLGHYFHTVDSPNGPQQKLILIRLAEVPPSDTFAAGATP
ncbi:MAG TPA: hypothetical protein VFW73_09290 [Lacipirellulaceae bacterium]|nr:hypothetical protein [Lacipirellulaceae bacterium]